MSLVEIKKEGPIDKGVTRNKVLDFDQGMAINLQIKAGETVPRHHANTDVIVYVASGEVLFGVEENRHHMKEGALLHLKPFEKQDIEALQDASLLVFKIGSNPRCSL